jgi:hypothetical protein
MAAIKKVLGSKTGSKYVVVPKNSGINIGDYVIIKKIEVSNNDKKFLDGEPIKEETKTPINIGQDKIADVLKKITDDVKKEIDNINKEVEFK